MPVLTLISDGFFAVCSGVAKAIRTTNETVNYVFRINYEVVSTVYYYVSLIVLTLYSITQIISNIVTAVLQYAGEFFNEVFGCVCALCVLLWRIVVLIYKVICFILSGLETLAVVLWTGSYVTVKTLKQSAIDICDYCGSTWNYATDMITELFCGIMGSFSSIGNLVLSGYSQINEGISYCLMSIYSGICNSLSALENSIKNMFHNIIYFYTSYLPSLGKETYLGILICGLLYLAVIKVVIYLTDNGMTLFTRQRRRQQMTILDSDDEDWSDNEQNESVVSDSSEYQDGTEVNDSDDMSEHTIDDNDDDDSEVSLNSQTFSSSDEEEDEIEVELPAVSDRYGMRNRSMTPSRPKNISPEEFEREIEKEKDKRKCVVCQDQSKSVLILPCRHMCLCVGCADQIVRARYIERRVCPLCRQRIQKVMNVYT
ncbi:hypothetical protein SNE40_023130 [Patella caerulea]|uniref:RING-type domain-containing protein n=1 Tax=Patella caerulea TaxID=87958 RepID=A0AAN8IVS4_PATCE